MKEILQSIKNFPKQCSSDEKTVFIVGVSIFLPYFITVPVILWAVAKAAMNGRLMYAVKHVPKAYVLLAFSVLITIVALIYGNWLGAVLGIGILLLMLFMLYYRTVVTKPLLEVLMDIFIIMSLLCAVYAVFEYIYYIVVQLKWNIFTLPIAAKREYRVHVGFFNSNYYAMMIEFVILMCVYKIYEIKVKKQRTFYLAAMFVNAFILYISGCRTAWPALLAGIALILILHKNKIMLGLVGVGVVGVVGFFAWKPKYIPRISYLKRNVGVRFKIWRAAVKGIKLHPLFGQGALTYFFTYKLYKGHKTQHAHNIILDPLMSFGIVGTFLALIYLASSFREIWQLYRKKYDMGLFALILGMIAVTCIHGMLDYTIFWVQTALCFFMIFHGASIYAASYREQN